jgi:hypothetical protein
MIKKLLLYFKWLFCDYPPYAVTFEAYLDKLRKDNPDNQIYPPEGIIYFINENNFYWKIKKARLVKTSRKALRGRK